MISRRNFVLTAAAAASVRAAPPRTNMGIATTSYMTVWKPRDTLEFLEHCHQIGAAGIQAGLSSREPAYLSKLRARAEQLGMYIEVMVGLPKRDDAGAFEGSLRAAKEAGASCVRAGCLNGRRYETFATLPEWQVFVSESIASIRRAVPVLERVKIPLALENHKDWTVQEMAALMKDQSSEYLGVCLDFGNNIALLDDPLAVLDLVPWTLATHVKDMAVEPYGDGFLLSEVTLGEGILDLNKIVSAIKAARPKTHLTLEMITRDPLEVPCLTDKYWTTFPDRGGIVLARTLQTVRKAAGRLQALPRISGQSKPAQMRLEEQNIEICLHYAREHFG